MTATHAPTPSPALVRLQALRQRDPRVFWGALVVAVVLVVLVVAALASQHASGPDYSRFDATTQKAIALANSTCQTTADPETVAIVQHSDGSVEWRLDSTTDGHRFVALGTPTDLGSRLTMNVYCSVG